MAAVDVIDGADDGEIAEWLYGRLSSALEKSAGAPLPICIPGGSTPFPILEKLGSMPLDWSRLTVWPGDDRIVEEAHPASNAGRIRRLVEPLGARLHPLGEADQPPHFALVWLGMGADGHIASLFPNTDPRADDPERIRRLTPDPLPPEAPFDRISLTIPALVDSDELMFVVRGEDKRAVLTEALHGESDLPITRLLRAASQPVTCFI